jgi:hypothetical protein
LRISSCHQLSQGSSREMSQDGEAERFNGLGRLAQSVGLRNHRPKGGSRLAPRSVNQPTFRSFLLQWFSAESP